MEIINRFVHSQLLFADRKDNNIFALLNEIHQENFVFYLFPKINRMHKINMPLAVLNKLLCILIKVFFLKFLLHSASLLCIAY